MHPTIAQLAERETVEAKQLSLGHWFESGWTETFLFVRMIINVQKNVPKESCKALEIIFVELFVYETLVTAKTGDARNTAFTLLAIKFPACITTTSDAFMTF